MKVGPIRMTDFDADFQVWEEQLQPGRGRPNGDDWHGPNDHRSLARRIWLRWVETLDPEFPYLFP